MYAQSHSEADHISVISWYLMGQTIKSKYLLISIYNYIVSSNSVHYIDLMLEETWGQVNFFCFM